MGPDSSPSTAPPAEESSRPAGAPLSKRTFIARLALGVVAIALCVVALTGLALYQNLRHYQERAAASAQNMAQLLEQFIGSAIEKNNIALYSVAHEYEEQLAEGHVDAAELNAFIARIFGELSFIDGMGIADETGIVRYGIRVVPSARASVADRDYFIRLRDEPGSGLVVSRPVLGRVSGRWLINLARRVNRPDGSFGGVVYAGITLERFAETFSALDIGQHGIVTLRDADFNLIVRHPELADGPSVGKATMSPQLQALIQAGHDSGTYTVTSVVDGIERTNAFRRVPGHPLYVTVGLATEDYLAVWRDEAAKASTLATLFVLGAVLAALLIYRSWERRTAAVRALAEQEEKYRGLVESTSDWIWEIGADYRFTYASPQVEELLGYRPDEVLGKTIFELLAPSEAERLRRKLLDPALGRKPFSGIEKVVLGKHGGEKILESNGVPILDAAGGFAGFRGISRDATERKAQEAELGLAASVFDNTMEGVMVTDAGGTILSVNPAFSEITGYSAGEAVGNKPSMLRSEHHGPDFYRDMWDKLQRDGRWNGEVWNRRKNGEAFLEWLTISRVAGPDGQPPRYVGLFSDITELRRKDEKIRHQAFHDPLTGLPNRSLLLDRLEHGIAVASRESSRLALMFIDLDRFKAVNDSLGHDIGDGLLQSVAARLRDCLRQSDTIARMGGDEFVVLLEPAGGAEADASLAQKIIDSLARPMGVAGHAIQIGASIGIACFPDDGASVFDLMKHADAAMYAAKSAGRNTFRFFQTAMTDQAEQRLQLEMELRQAVSRGELELFYQPQVTLADGAPFCVEALLRWRHPKHGLLPPAEFLPLAEETGIIGEIGDWVLAEACRQCRAWRDEGLGGVRIAVNVSARQLQQGNLAERIAELARQHGVAPGCLEIELTESAVMAGPDKVAASLGRLRALGIRIAMDDFGTGYSSLAHLRRLPLDALKIDRSFVLDIEREDDDAQVVHTVLALARSLGLPAVAEGVETAAHAAFLRACGCSAGQGYFYARPAPAAATAEWLRERRLPQAGRESAGDRLSNA